MCDNRSYETENMFQDTCCCLEELEEQKSVQ